MIPSATDLSYFIEVAETGNVSRAAERLGISQPSLSVALQRLEQSVGMALLTRSRKGVALTQAGHQLLAHARRLLQSWEEIRAATMASVTEVRGRYTIGCHVSVALDTLPRFLPRLLTAHPELDIRLKHDLSRRIVEDVVSMKVDIGIVVNPLQHPDLVVHKLCEDEVSFWTVAQDKMAEKSLAEKRAVLVCDPDLVQTQVLIKEIRRRREGFVRTVETDSLEVIADLTAYGAGIGLLPARVAVRAPQRLRRVRGAPVFYDEYCLIYRVENRSVKAIGALSTAIRAVFSTPRG